MSPPAQAEPPSRSFDAALAEAADLCEQVVLAPGGTIPIPVGTAFFMDIPKKMGSMNSLLQLPAMVSGFAKTQPVSDIQPLSATMLFPATNADVWVLMFGTFPVCDVLISRSEDTPATVAALAADRASRGWELVLSKPSSKAMPAAEHLLVRRIPKPDESGFGIMLRMRVFATWVGNRNGPQGALNFFAGRLKLTRAPR